MNQPASGSLAPELTARTQQLAHLAVHGGVDLKPGQDVVIRANDITQAPLARAIAEEAYKAGAGLVSLVYWDHPVKRSRLLYADEASLQRVPDWWDRHIEECVERKGAYISLSSDPHQGLFTDIDPDRLGKDRLPWTSAYLPMLQNDLAEVTWTHIPGPTSEVAERVLGTSDVGQLWDALVPILRLDAESPEQAWRDRMVDLERRATDLGHHRFTELHFSGPGTDLKVGLVQGANWCCASLGADGDNRRLICNLPTEEVFTTPDCRRVEGTASVTKPVTLPGGAVVEGLELRFEAGRIVDLSATRNADAMKAFIAVDEGASRLGEVALVDEDSPVARSGLVFGEVLLDENAACHIAVGQAYAATVPGLTEDPREWEARGLNTSAVHHDVMIGGPEVSVDGIDSEQNRTPVIRDGNWIL